MASPGFLGRRRLLADDDASRLARIRAKLRHLDAANLLAPGPPVRRASLEAFEAEAGVTVPAQLRSFALEIGLGGAGPGHGLLPLQSWLEAIIDPTPGILATPCPLDPARDYYEYDEYEDPAQGAIALCSEGASAPYTLLVVAGSNRGRLVRYEVDTRWCEWIEGASPPGPAEFFDWYEGWLDLVGLGIWPNFYGVGLIGTQAQLTAVVADDLEPSQRRHRALVSLSYLPTLKDESVPVIRDLYERGAAELRAAALPLLAKLSEDPAAMLYEALVAPEPVVRHAALREIRVRKPPDALEHLARATDDADDRIAEVALMAIEGTPHLDLERLTRLYERSALRQRVVWNLGKLDSADALPLLTRGLEDPSGPVRRISAFSIADLGLAEGLPLLDRALAREFDLDVRRPMQRALHELQERCS